MSKIRASRKSIQKTNDLQGNKALPFPLIKKSACIEITEEQIKSLAIKGRSNVLD